MERPILFSTPMVQAILEGRKTQTRRIVKPQGKAVCFDIAMRTDGSDKWPRNLGADEKFISYMKCPYGSVGDILWVRETFSIIGTDVIRDSGSGAILDEIPQYVFKGQKQPHIEMLLKWKPSIFMPREACRILLEITDIKVERLQDISEEDAMAEGISLPNYAEQAIKDVHYPDPSEIYASLWESINGKGSWDKNPWVWVISFEINKQR